MPICKNCGNVFEGKFCTSCGTPNPEAQNAQPVQTPPPVTPPVQMPRPQQFTPPPAPIYNNVSVIQQNKVTSTGGWIGWLFLLYFFPIIGHIIMLLCSNDESAKNYVKAQLIFILIAVLILAALILIPVAVGMSSNM